MIVSIPKWMITTSRRQGRFREKMSEGSPSAKRRAYGQKHHRRPSLRVSGHKITKPFGSGDKVNDEVVS